MYDHVHGSDFTSDAKPETAGTALPGVLHLKPANQATRQRRLRRQRPSSRPGRGQEKGLTV